MINRFGSGSVGEGRFSEPADGNDKQSSYADIFTIGRLILRRWQLLTTLVGATVLLTTAVLLLLPNRYTSQATILPSGTVDELNRLTEMAGFGWTLPADENSSELFPAILRSHLAADAVLEKEYTFDHHGTTTRIRLNEYFGQDIPDKLRQLLHGITAISLDKKTGVITVAVETTYPGLSQSIVQQYLTELEHFNLHKRRSQAGENVDYLTRQLAQIKLELKQVEDTLARFQEANRDWAVTSDPVILKHLGRLRRNVELKSTTYLFLNRELEAAKLDAQKDIPIIRILDRPSLPTVKSGPRRGIILATVFMFTMLAGMAGVILHEALRRRTAGPNRESYLALKQDMVETFPRITRLTRKHRQHEPMPR